jgi:diguanylate cyclase (GGDEF)-like protein
VEQALLLAAREKRSVGVAIVDLDGFKSVNDALGHQMGDRLLRQVSMRLRDAVRGSDSVCRYGGDEFALLLLGSAGDAGSPVVAARRILDALHGVVDLDGQPVEPQACAGLALYPQHGADLAALLRAADIALYTAKRDGGGVAVYQFEDRGLATQTGAQ